jgi:hypothetical protein
MERAQGASEEGVSSREIVVAEGWEPLCKFLNKPIPDEPFPHLNDTQEFRRHIHL